MRCKRRTVLSQRRAGEFTVVVAGYPAGTVDPLHEHAFAHVSIVLKGKALDVRAGMPEWHFQSTATSQAPEQPHTMYFPIETQVLSIMMPRAPRWRAPVATTCIPNDLDTRERVLEFIQRADAQAASTSIPLWIDRAVRTFPWASGTPLRELALSAGVSQAHFDRTFRTCFGQSPRQYRRRAKLAIASKLLLYSDASIAQAALAAHFTDQSHLTAAFARAFETTPANYRRRFMQTSL
jgi:AraC-like DNA-binding protein